MPREACVLAEEKGIGQVVLCGDCDDVHLAMGSVVLRLERGSFRRVARMLRTAAEHASLAPAPAPEPGARYSLEFVDGLPRFKAWARRKKKSDRRKP